MVLYQMCYSSICYSADPKSQILSRPCVFRGVVDHAEDCGAAWEPLGWHLIPPFALKSENSFGNSIKWLDCATSTPEKIQDIFTHSPDPQFRKCLFNDDLWNIIMIGEDRSADLVSGCNMVCLCCRWWNPQREQSFHQQQRSQRCREEPAVWRQKHGSVWGEALWLLP